VSLRQVRQGNKVNLRRKRLYILPGTRIQQRRSGGDSSQYSDSSFALPSDSVLRSVGIFAYKI